MFVQVIDQLTNFEKYTGQMIGEQVYHLINTLHVPTIINYA